MSVCEITKQTLLMWIWAAVTVHTFILLNDPLAGENKSPARLVSYANCFHLKNTNHLVLLISANAVMNGHVNICDMWHWQIYILAHEYFRRRLVFQSCFSPALLLRWHERRELLTVFRCLAALRFKSWEIQLYIKMLMEQHSHLIV